MKTLAIILILFAAPAFADVGHYDRNFPPIDAEVCYVVDTSVLHRYDNSPSQKESEPIITDKRLDFIWNVLTVIATPLSF